MKKKLLMAILVTLSIYADAQFSKKVNQWQFPTNCGLDFNAGAPVQVIGGQITTTEGSSSIADDNGALLFYTDGITVWNKNHIAMPNGTGLNGNSSSSQAALIVQQPASNNLYYIFTTDDVANLNGMQYSVVDMTLGGGNGAVTIKNIPLVTPTCEKVTGCRHANGQDIWIVTHKYNNAEFYAYLLTSAGLNTTPVITSVGTINTGFGGANAIGYMKISPDGKKLASAVSRSNIFELFDFDNATGIPSNPVSLPVSDYTYGVEFSPNSKILYGSLFTNPIYQFDLTAGSPAAIIASMLLIGTSSSPELGALQLAPDGKIYAARKTLNMLGIIQNPDVLGMGCNYVDNGFTFSGTTVYYGLPNMLPSYFTGVSSQNYCFGDSTLFTVSDSTSYVICSWNFDDPASGVLNTSPFFNSGHVFTAPGNYNVQVVLVNSFAVSDTLYLPVVISPSPALSLGNDTMVCTGSTYIVDASGSGAATYLWQNGNTNSSIAVTTSGTYYVTASNNTCSATDTIIVTFAPCAIPVVQFYSSDSSWCEKQAIDFFDLSTNNPTSWLWTFSGAVPTSSTDQNPAGIYYPGYGSFDVTLIACNAAGCDTLTQYNFVTEHQSPPTPVVTISNDTLYCSSAGAYAWYNTNNTSLVLATTAFYYPTQSGSYFVIITDSNGCSTPSATVVISSVTDNNGHAYYLQCIMNYAGDYFLSITTNLESYNTRVYDSQSKLIFDSRTNSEGQLLVNVNRWSPGIYFVMAGNEKYMLRQKVILLK